MDDLHAAVAAFLRVERRRPLRAPRAFTCRDCGRLVREDVPSPEYPFAALWVPLRCPACFSVALEREAEDPIFGIWRNRRGEPGRMGQPSTRDAAVKRAQAEYR
jgi:hypothetical protein